MDCWRSGLSTQPILDALISSLRTIQARFRSLDSLTIHDDVLSGAPLCFRLHLLKKMTLTWVIIGTSDQAWEVIMVVQICVMGIYGSIFSLVSGQQPTTKQKVALTKTNDSWILSPGLVLAKNENLGPVHWAQPRWTCRQCQPSQASILGRGDKSLCFEST